MKKRSEHRWLSTEEIMDQMDAIGAKLDDIEERLAATSAQIKELKDMKLDKSYMIEREG
jgi:hypothetical protein